jgi:hypothetical protein
MQWYTSFLFRSFCPVHHGGSILVVRYCCPVWLSSPGSPVFSWLSFPNYLSWLSRPGCPVPPVLFWRFCSSVKYCAEIFTLERDKLTRESWFHISTLVGIEPWSLKTESKQVDHWTSGTVYECSEIVGSPQDSPPPAADYVGCEARRRTYSKRETGT